jgi:CheY-like chemotaxis protein
MDAPGDRRACVDEPGGWRVLIVEDDPFVALVLEDLLVDLGLVVAGTARSVAAALALAATERFDVALLDVNLGLERVDPVADFLARLGCPFVFATGYGKAGAPAAHAGRPVIEKPFLSETLIAALRAEISSRTTSTQKA